MGSPFVATTVTNYNSNPPSDDGSQTAANRVQWSTQKTKLSDPLKTAFDTSETATQTAFGKIIGGAGVTTTAVSYAVTASDQGKLVNATVASITITTPDATVVGSPFVFSLLNSSSGSITFDGSGSQTIDGSDAIVIPPGCGVIVYTDGANWNTTGQNFPAVVPAVYKNLSIKVASNTTVTVAADFIVTTNGSNYKSTALSSTINLGTTGANALDTGTIAVSTWYAIWAIAKADGTTAGLASTSFTAPTMPTGYTFKARVGWVRTASGSAQLHGTWQFGRVVQYVIGLAQTLNIPNIANGTAGSYSVTSPTLAAASIVSVVPTTASVITVTATQSYGGLSPASILVAPNTSWGGANNGPNGSGANVYPIWLQGGQLQGSVTTRMLLETTSIAWASSAAGGGISCLGWEDNI
jgi:hypothetical protein